MNKTSAHICVCICTYKRPQYLRRLLEELGKQVTGGLFTYSVVVVDNDRLRSAEAQVSDVAASSSIPIRYYVEPTQSIPRARNKAVANAVGEYVAFIDDDEFPEANWLLTLFGALKRYGVAGVLGSVCRHFDEEPPKWVVRGRFWQRPTYPTGFVIDEWMGRTSNALVKRELFAANQEAFRPEFRSGEDREFFSRMVRQGHVFVYCNEAVVYETVPPVRWKRSFILRRSLLHGSFAARQRTFGAVGLAKSIIAVPVYITVLPFAQIIGHHRFMALLLKLAYHSGRILTCLGITAIKEPYVTD